MEDKKHMVKVIMVEDRYFRGYRDNGTILTAWSLPGARFYSTWGEAFKRDIEKLKKQKRKIVILTFTTEYLYSRDEVKNE